MFRFTIRDVLWLTVVVAVALTLWLGWSRETAKLRKESAARREADYEQWRTSWNDLHAEYTKVRTQLQKQPTLTDQGGNDKSVGTGEPATLFDP